MLSSEERYLTLRSSRLHAFRLFLYALIITITISYALRVLRWCFRAATNRVFWYLFFLSILSLWWRTATSFFCVCLLFLLCVDNILGRGRASLLLFFIITIVISEHRKHDQFMWGSAAPQRRELVSRKAIKWVFRQMLTRVVK